MKVILKQDVNKIGKKDDLLEVADGYGRNFLIARGLAEEATEGKVRELQQMQKTQKIKDDKKLKAELDVRIRHPRGRKAGLFVLTPGKHYRVHLPFDTQSRKRKKGEENGEI